MLRPLWRNHKVLDFSINFWPVTEFLQFLERTSQYQNEILDAFPLNCHNLSEKPSITQIYSPKNPIKSTYNFIPATFSFSKNISMGFWLTDNKLYHVIKKHIEINFSQMNFAKLHNPIIIYLFNKPNKKLFSRH